MKKGSGRNRIFTTTGGERFPNVNPKTALPFLLTVPACPDQRGAAADPLYCRVEIPTIRFNRENTRLNPYFLWAWTRFPLSEKTSSSVCQKEHFTGLSEIHSCLPPLIPAVTRTNLFPRDRPGAAKPYRKPASSQHQTALQKC